MIKVRLNVHRIVGDQVPIPVEPLRSLFKMAQVDLSITEIPGSIAKDPVSPDGAGGYGEVMHAILARQPSPPVLGDPAHLIVGQSWTGEDGDAANGMLLDLMRRGFAAVFRLSRDLIGGNPSKLLQTCAHEIGHMLNLVHEDGREKVPTAMCQAWIRDQFTGTFDQAWKNANLVRPAGVNAFPFGDNEQTRLDMASAAVLPWGSVFNGLGGGGAEDVAKPSLELGVTANHSMCEGGSLFLEVEVKNTGKRSVKIPSRFDSTMQNLQIVIRGPDGLHYIHHPKTISCSGSMATLAPGQGSFHAQTISHRFYGSVFPVPGRYTIWVTSPWSKTPSPSLEVQVKRDPQLSTTLTAPAFARFLAQGAPRKNRTQTRKLDELIRSGRRAGSAEISRLALLRARAISDPAKQDELLAIARNPSSPRAIRHAAVMHQSTVSKADLKKCKELMRAAEQDFLGEADTALREWLRVAKMGLDLQTEVR